MAPRSRNMTELDQPLTRREFLEFRTNLDARLETFGAKFATKEEMAEGFAEMRAHVEAAIGSAEARLRTHFDIVAESFRTEFRNLYDWTHTITGGLASRVEILETDHGAQLKALDLRVTHLENNTRRARGGRRRR